jgi:replicative DNA helicase
VENKIKHGDMVFNPSHIASNTIQVIEERKNSPDMGVYTGFPPLDRDMLPLVPGELMVVTARPGNWKTGFMLGMAEHESNVIVKQKLENEVAVYVTWEISIEEAGLMELCGKTGINTSYVARGMTTDEQLVMLKREAIKRSGTPLWMLGHSNVNNERRVGLSVEELWTAFQYMQDELGLKIRVAFLDYLNRIRFEDSRERRLQVELAVNSLKDMALGLGTRIVVGSQAKRNVDERVVKIPTMSDSMESSAIEHVADKMIGAWIPKTTEAVGDELPSFPGYYVKENSLVLGLAKQKYGIAQTKYLAEIDYRSRLLKEVYKDGEKATQQSLIP